MNEKKLRKSGVVIALYVIAALSVLYAVFVIASSVAYVSQYYAQYGMKPGFTDYFSQVMSAAYMPVFSAIVLFASARILNEVRALNPAYYATAEEIAAAKAAKAAMKEAKKAAKEATDEDIAAVAAAVDAEGIIEADAELAELEDAAEALEKEVPAETEEAVEAEETAEVEAEAEEKTEE